MQLIKRRAFWISFCASTREVFLLPPADSSVVGVVGLVVHHQLVVHKVEAVTARLKGVLDHQLDGGRVKLGELVDVLAGVLAVGDAEAEVEVEGLEVAIPEEVALDHSEVRDRLRTDAELHRGANSLELQELKNKKI